MLPVYVAGVGMTQFGKNAASLVEMMRDAATLALSNSKIQEIDALYIAVMNPEEFTGDGNFASHVVDALGFAGIPAIRVETASSAGAAAFQAGFQGIASGYYRQVLVIGGEKMTHLTTSASTRIIAKVIDAQERLCGATMPALAAMVAEKYRRKYHWSESRMERMLCSVAMKNHANGALNPAAQFRQAISKEKYFAGKLVATPLRLHDCAPMTDGAAAVILTATPTDLVVSGLGQGSGPVSLRERETLTSFPATQIAARKAYQMAGVKPGEIDCAEVHDAFTPFEIIGTEDLGFFPPGTGGQAVESGKTAANGDLPINASGGLKSRGHPMGASGVAQIVEIARQLRGESATKFKREPRRGLAQSVGGLASNNFVTIIERAGMAAPPAAPMTAAHSYLAPPATKKQAPPVPTESEGVIDTFTILYTTPDGFLPPLALALIRDRHGNRVMAQGEDINQLRIGRDVYLNQIAGISYFTVKSHLQQVREAMQKLLRKNGGTSPQNQSNDGKR